MKWLIAIAVIGACGGAAPQAHSAEPKPWDPHLEERSKPAEPADAVSHAEMGQAGLKQLEVIELLHQQVLVLDKQVDDLNRRVQLLEKFAGVVQDLLQHERDIGVLK